MHFDFTFRGRRYTCVSESRGVHSHEPGTMALAAISNAYWYATVDGREFKLFPSKPDDVTGHENRGRLQRQIILTVAKLEAEA